MRPENRRSKQSQSSPFDSLIIVSSRAKPCVGGRRCFELTRIFSGGERDAQSIHRGLRIARAGAQKRSSAARGCRVFSGARRAAESEAGRVHHRYRRSRAGGCGAGRKDERCGRGQAAAVWRCLFAQGLALDERYSHDLRLEEFRELARAGRCGTCGAAGELPAEFCSGKPRRPNSGCGRLPRAVCVRRREIRGTSNIPRAARAAGRRLRSPPECIPSRRAATAAARCESRRRAAGWWESSRRAGESRARRRTANHGAGFRPPGRLRARFATRR